MLLHEVLDTAKLKEHINNGYVTVREHPTLPLFIYNYSHKTQWESYWDDVTLKCRGLIVDDEKRIVARGFRKFFNYGQKESAHLDTSGPVQVTDKADGSLAIVAFYCNELVVATRGSFESTQAKFAYQHIVDNYYDAFKILCSQDSTVLCEIIYPENRIVLDYGEMRDIILIGVQSNIEQSDGRQLWTPADTIYSWPGPKVQKFDCSTFEDALRLPPRDNAEGVVIYFEKTGERLKLKYPQYLRLHKLISNLTPKVIWESLAAGQGIEDMIDEVPDEFHQYVRDVSSSLLKQFNNILSNVTLAFNFTLEILPNKWTRKDFADCVKNSPTKTLLFLMLDGKSDRLIECIWENVKPTGEEWSEDV